MSDAAQDSEDFSLLDVEGIFWHPADLVGFQLMLVVPDTDDSFTCLAYLPHTTGDRYRSGWWNTLDKCLVGTCWAGSYHCRCNDNDNAIGVIHCETALPMACVAQPQRCIKGHYILLKCTFMYVNSV